MEEVLTSRPSLDVGGERHPVKQSGSKTHNSPWGYLPQIHRISRKAIRNSLTLIANKKKCGLVYPLDDNRTYFLVLQ